MALDWLASDQPGQAEVLAQVDYVLARVEKSRAKTVFCCPLTCRLKTLRIRGLPIWRNDISHCCRRRLNRSGDRSSGVVCGGSHARNHSHSDGSVRSLGARSERRGDRGYGKTDELRSARPDSAADADRALHG